jgi:hypothetical protein
MDAYRKEVDARHNATVRKAMTGMPLETALIPVPFHTYTFVLLAHAVETTLLLVPFHAYARASRSYLCAPRTWRWICTTQCTGSCLRTYISLVPRPSRPPSLLCLI